jgi:hypothetical protein
MLTYLCDLKATAIAKSISIWIFVATWDKKKTRAYHSIGFVGYHED